jgi:hypothetical protein
MRKAVLLLLVSLLALAVTAADRPDAYTIVDTPLAQGPFSDAAHVAELPVHTSVSVETRKGGWYQVNLATGQSGWLRMTTLEFTGTLGRVRNSALTAMLGLFESGRSGASGATATTGVRGLNTGDIANATPDTAAVDGLKAWAATPDDARQYSAQLPLKPHAVDYVDAAGKPGKP